MTKDDPVHIHLPLNSMRLVCNVCREMIDCKRPASLTAIEEIHRVFQEKHKDCIAKKYTT